MLLEALLLLAPLVELEWDAPASCPSADAFEERVRAQADVRAEADAPAVLMARVVIRELGAEQWELSLEMERGGEQEARTFEAESCEAVAAVAATLVSLRVVEWVKPAPLVPEPEREPKREPEPPSQTDVEARPRVQPDASETQTPEVVRQTPARRPPELGGWISVLGGVAFGVAPAVGGAVAIEGGLEGRWWRAGLGVQTTPRRVQAHPNDSEVDGRFDVLTAEALACGVPRAGPVEFPICGRVSAGGMRANGEGNVGLSEPAWGAWSGFGGSAAAAWHLTEFFAPVLSLEALAPLRDRSYSVGGVPGTLHRTGAVALRAWAGLEIHL